MGEGENTFSDLLIGINNREKQIYADNLISIHQPNFTLRPLIDNLDDLPFPDYDGIYKEDKWIRQLPVKRFMPSRGCPFNCLIVLIIYITKSTKDMVE